ncbi:hypothetical protein M430DRAFT_34409 [Amorphotheca resinae ATCC 22711]|uniref:Required for respiratory growth protein 9, mitochondrial n=1 Tax=Amorphotheca resinae ATCC 22711 TaxID=857342 RepID=A0A2T3B2W4_AMORE|nr:hypothetical protein M430DRAFT_34409 [Amorphotheca resinae ATCC 22711]PSS19980.1 hypothetical protein M430DRAFT_34409 [Amorphotheca resinae ATCC 22711]
MPCLCTTNTLKLFIRTLTQVEVFPSAIRASGFSQSAAGRRIAPARSIRGLHSTPARLDSTPPEPAAAATEEPQSQSKQWTEGLRVEKGVNLKDPESALVELSPEAIDAIAAEVVKDTTPYETSSTEPPSEPTTAGEPVSRTTIRRTKVQNTGLAIHYSSPRASTNASSEDRPDSGSSDDKASAKSSSKDDWKPPPREPWQIYKQALKEKFPNGWNPRRRLSPDALAGIRALHAQMPEVYTTSALAANFKVSPEDIRRILKSKWTPDPEEESDRQRRWFNRGKQIYAKHAAMGQKPPRRWRELGIGNGKPEWMKKKQQAAARLPALITTAKRAPQPSEGSVDPDSFADKIL